MIGKIKTSKKIILGIILLLACIHAAAGLEIRVCNEDGQERLVFEPGSTVVFRSAVPEDVSTATIVILKDNNPVETGRMKVFSLKPREIAYSYKFPESAEQGRYTARILAKEGSTTTVSSEFYIGSEEEMGFVANSSGGENNGKLPFFQRIWIFIRGLFGK